MASLTQSPPPDRRPSPLLSNNPFRKVTSENLAAGQPSPALPTQSINIPPPRNPFLDSEDVVASAPTLAMPGSFPKDSPTKSTFGDGTRKLLENLSFDKKPTRAAPPPPPPHMGMKQRAENIPPQTNGQMGPPLHRPTQSEEERRRNAAKPRGPPGELNIFADPRDPNKAQERRPRRSSETSTRDKTGRTLDPEDERRRRERRRRESRRDAKGKPPSRRLDIIDKLDVTSIYGTGLFHHDGPFDACNPSRNRKGARAAPMQAFPKDSRNMALGGSGPNHSRLNLDQIHGTAEEAHHDYSTSAVADEYEENLRRPNPERSASFNPTARVEPLHGEESIGLGTSTFLEGAPASRAAIQRRESENEAAMAMGNNPAGLSRKKSLAQKIRGVRPGGRMTSPEPRSTTPTSPPITGPLGTGKSESNTNPFFVNYDNEYEKKGAQIQFRAEDKTGRPRGSSSPRRGLGLERKTTNDSFGGAEEGKSIGSGFLNRVKSLKGPRKTRAERREASG